MTHSIKINALEHIRDKAQRDIDEIERQIDEEERPMVGDTVRMNCHKSGYHGCVGQVLKIFGAGTMYEIEFGSGERIRLCATRSVLEKVISAPKPRRWYNRAEFITFIFAHPVILVRTIKDGADMFLGVYALWSDSYSITAYRLNVSEDNFKEKEFSTDGKSWQSFGVEV